MCECEMIYYGNPILHEESKPVDLKRIQDYDDIVEEMFQVMESDHGIGLAAIQIGFPYKIFTWDKDQVVYNPWLEFPMDSGFQYDEESCLSAPNKFVSVQRRTKTRLRGWDQKLDPICEDAEGYFARVFQHEMDHLDGFCIIDQCNREMRRKIIKEHKRKGMI